LKFNIPVINYTECSAPSGTAQYIVQVERQDEHTRPEVKCWTAKHKTHWSWKSWKTRPLWLKPLDVTISNLARSKP